MSPHSHETFVQAPGFFDLSGKKELKIPLKREGREVGIHFEKNQKKSYWKMTTQTSSKFEKIKKQRRWKKVALFFFT